MQSHSSAQKTSQANGSGGFFQPAAFSPVHLPFANLSFLRQRHALSLSVSGRARGRSSNFHQRVYAFLSRAGTKLFKRARGDFTGRKRVDFNKHRQKCALCIIEWASLSFHATTWKILARERTHMRADRCCRVNDKSDPSLALLSKKASAASTHSDQKSPFQNASHLIRRAYQKTKEKQHVFRFARLKEVSEHQICIIHETSWPGSLSVPLH